MPDPSILSTLSFLDSAIVPGILGLVFGGRYLYRRFVKDGVETVKDRAEVDIIAVYKQELDSLRERNRTLESGRMQALEATVKLTEDLSSIKTKVLALQDELQVVRTQLVNQSNMMERLLDENRALQGELHARRVKE